MIPFFSRTPASPGMALALGLVEGALAVLAVVALIAWVTR
jgi:hypothetical protein